MPRRLKAARKQRFTHADLQALRGAIARGFPWLHQPSGEDVPGYFDLLGLVKDCFFDFALDYVAEDDEEGQRALWDLVKSDILAEHCRRRPGSRPAFWWKYEAPEKLRMTGTQLTRCVGQFNSESIYRPVEEGEGEPVYEDSFSYLKRLKLFTLQETEIFEKYKWICYARISSGIFGKCPDCWAKARELAKEIDFDLDAAVLPEHETFWLPEDLVFDCDHGGSSPFNRGIFELDCDV